MKRNPIRKVKRVELPLANQSKESVDRYLHELGLTVNMTPARDALFVVNCSRAKSSETGAMKAKLLYQGRSIQHFSDNCRKAQRPFGIISDLYGLVLADELVESYDLPPKKLNDEQLWELGALIRAKCDNLDISSLHFIAGSPIFAVPYLIQLLASGVPFTYSTAFFKPTKTHSLGL